MREWKARAIEKLGLRPGANDRVVLDEILRVDVRGGSTILRIRDHFATWAYTQVEIGQITKEESATTMQGIISLIHKLRMRGRDMYEMMPADTSAQYEFNEEDFQPPADYED